MAQTAPFSSDTLMDLLRTIRTPQTGLSLASAGRLESCTVDDTGRLTLTLTVPREQAPELSGLCDEAAQKLQTLPNVTSATLILTAHRPAGAPEPNTGPQRSTPAAAQPAAGGHRPLGGPAAPDAPVLPGVKTIIAVASGKGGVGKSTTAVNLAVGLGMEGLKTGLLDADIHGPSLHRMLGTTGKPEVVEGRLQPVQAWGIRAVSLGMLVDEKAAMIWRGPMVMGAINQLLGDVDWGALDVLVVDLPPGTGDAHLSLTQKVPLGGAVIVSTPQDIALIDARRGVTMFEKLHVPVLGLVENMSYFCCPNCGHNTELFGHGGARHEAEAMGVPFLGEVPLLADIRSSADSGVPLVIGAPQSEGGKAWRAIAHTVATAIQTLQA